ncbi:MAG: class I SAM-dependent methyltransferase [Weeksellaceae bacterium]
MTAKAEHTERIQREKLHFTEQRLLSIYDWFNTQVSTRQGRSRHHLDIGCYNGFALPTLAQAADHVTTLDIDPLMLQTALLRPSVQQLVFAQRLTLDQMDARAITYPDNSFTSASCIEVIGAGFEDQEGNEIRANELEHIQSVINGVHRVLQPGGLFTLTFKSQSNQRLSEGFNFGTHKGVPLHRKDLRPMLEPLFGQVDWYGHVWTARIPRIGNKYYMGIPVVETRDETGKYDELDPECFEPISEAQLQADGKRPLYWIAMCQKPFE